MSNAHSMCISKENLWAHHEFDIKSSEILEAAFIGL